MASNTRGPKATSTRKRKPQVTTTTANENTTTETTVAPATFDERVTHYKVMGAGASAVIIPARRYNPELHPNAEPLNLDD